MIIRIKNSQKKQKLASERIKTRLRVLLESLGFPDAEVSIFFSGDGTIRSLNRKYRGNNAVTDVLSFSLREGEFSHIHPELLGDIVISVPAAVRQAGESGHSVSKEIDRLLIHGLLHLIGYDHERSREDEIKMRRKEAHLLKNGVGHKGAKTRMKTRKAKSNNK